MSHQIQFGFSAAFPGKLCVDLFCGGGGTSIGLEWALHRPVDIAINHNRTAIAMHEANHPRTKHYQEDILSLSPREVCGGRPVGLLWASPDCTGHSRAKGGKPRHKGNRALANVVIDWAREVSPDVIHLENVEEWCFPPETTVLSKRGMVPIGEIRVGDEVWTHNARWKPVTAVARRMSDTVRVDGYGNSIIETTTNHQFYARQYAPKITKSGKAGRHEVRLLEPEWVRADRLADCDDSTSYSRVYSGYAWASPTEMPRYWMRMPNALGVDTSSPAFFYMLGRWLGDGWIRRRKQKQNVVRICANVAEADELGEKLTSTGLAWYRSPHSDSVDVFDLAAESSRRLIPWLVSNFREHAEHKTLPAWIFGATEEQRWALVNGYCDSDGHEEPNGKATTVSVSRCLAVGIRLLLHSLGVPASISETEGGQQPHVRDPSRTMTCKTSYRVSWRDEPMWEKCHRSDLHLWGRVRSVAPARTSTEVVDITVADDHSFIADGQVVHNCDWGPLDENDLPIKERKGEDFRAWLAALIDLKYEVQWRTIVAADHGAPTTRKRLFLTARRDGKPIVWPAATHGNGRPKAWRSAAEIIDWSLPCPSIFGRKKPLADATLRRIAAGLRRYVLGASSPFIVPLTHQGGARVHSIDDPLRTVTCANRGELALVAPTLVQTGYGERDGQAPRALDIRKPLGTVVASGQKHAVAAFMLKHYGGVVGHSMDKTLGTVTCQDHHSLSLAWLEKLYGTGVGASVEEPLPTVTAIGQHLAEVRAFLVSYYGNGQPISIQDPLDTVTTRDRFGLVMVHGQPYRIVDIGMRMLSPRELFDAQGFPRSYIIDLEVDGRRITKTEQVEKAGNSVCPPAAHALVAANCNGREEAVAA